MNASFSAPAAESLLFSWEPPRQRRVAIIGFLAISLIAHALCFYVFQITYPPTVALLPPPARVSVIASDSEEGRTLLRWIDAEDPALAFTTQPPPETRLHALPKVEHIPSYRAAEPALKDVPPLAFDLRIPSARPPGAVPFVRRPTAPALRPAATSVSFSKELDGFGAPTLPKPSFAASNDESPQTLRVRVAVSGSGEIRYCFPLSSSGDLALDEQARRYLALGRFSQRLIGTEKADRSLAWGMATVEWGNDVARPKATPAGTVTP
jgi:hypothetical protein